jgi:hypothetical protein
VTSLFSRLQKLNKEATPQPWSAGAAGDDDTWELRSDAKPDAVIGYGERCFLPAEEMANGALIVECRNSLPAVLHAIDLLRRLSEWDALAPPVQAPFGDGPYWKREIDAALEPLMKEQP